MLHRFLGNDPGRHRHCSRVVRGVDQETYLCALHVRSIRARVATKHSVLSAVRKDHELMILAAADCTGIRLHSEIVETASLKDILIGRVVGAVDQIKVFRAVVKGIAIEHGKFTTAY